MMIEQHIQRPLSWDLAQSSTPVNFLFPHHNHSPDENPTNLSTLSHLIYTLPISGIGTASRTIGVNSQESILVILFSQSRLLYYKLMLCYIFQDLYTPESSSGTPCSIGSTVMQGSHNGAVLCPRALPTVIKAMNKTKKTLGTINLK